MVTWLARYRFFNSGHRLSGLDAGALGVESINLGTRGREGLMGKFAVLGNELYSGKKSIDFVGRKWLWYSVSAVILLIAIGGWTIKGLNFGIEFEGGVEYVVSVPQRSGEPGHGRRAA